MSFTTLLEKDTLVQKYLSVATKTCICCRTTSKVAERFERRILDEIMKMFNDSESFYFSLTGDITNSVQRQATSKEGETDNMKKLEWKFSKHILHWNQWIGEFLGQLIVSIQTTYVLDSEIDNSDQFYSRTTWKTVDDRFFFNKALVQELIDLNDSRADAWIVPFIQGYVEIQECPLGKCQYNL